MQTIFSSGVWLAAGERSGVGDGWRGGRRWGEVCAYVGEGAARWAGRDGVHR